MIGLVLTIGGAWLLIIGGSPYYLIAGMGMVAKGHWGFPAWVIGKLAIWLVITGLGHVVAKRFPALAVKAYWLMIVLATTAAYLAIYKP